MVSALANFKKTVDEEDEPQCRPSQHLLEEAHQILNAKTKRTCIVVLVVVVDGVVLSPSGAGLMIVVVDGVVVLGLELTEGKDSETTGKKRKAPGDDVKSDGGSKKQKKKEKEDAPDDASVEPASKRARGKRPEPCSAD